MSVASVILVGAEVLQPQDERARVLLGDDTGKPHGDGMTDELMGEKVLESADEMIDALRLAKRPWGLQYNPPDGTDTPQWFFRGHSDATWSLVPSAFREKSWEGIQPLAGFMLGQLASLPSEELRLLLEFARGLNRSGIPIPGGLGVIKQLEAAIHPSHGAADWPKQFLELAALAQHHGLPTRWLDFSTNPLVAAYFAAQEPAQNADELCVWAIHSFCLDSARPPFWIGVGHPQRASNPNLHAQSGVLVSWTTKPATLSPLDAVIQQVQAPNPKPDDRFRRLETAPIQKLRLARKHADHLRVLLEREHVSAAPLFPGVDGVVRDLKAPHRARPRGQRMV